MSTRSLRNFLSIAVVAGAAFLAVNFASPTLASAQHGHGGHRGHGGHGGHGGNHYRSAHGGHGHYSHGSHYSGYGHSSFRVQVAPPVYRYGSSYGSGYNCAPSYGHGSYVRPGLSLHFGF
jgi:hypothetical protein